MFEKFSDKYFVPISFIESIYLRYSLCREILGNLVKQHFCIATTRRSKKRKYSEADDANDKHTESDFTLIRSSDNTAISKSATLEYSADKKGETDISERTNTSDQLDLLSSSDDKDHNNDSKGMLSNTSKIVQTNVNITENAPPVSTDRYKCVHRIKIFEYYAFKKFSPSLVIFEFKVLAKLKVLVSQERSLIRNWNSRVQMFFPLLMVGL